MKYRYLILGLLFGLMLQFPPAAALVLILLAKPTVAGLAGGGWMHHRYGRRTPAKS